MTTPRSNCLDEETLHAFLAGRLSTDELQQADEHLDSCLECQSVFIEMAGAGSMGVVYAAYDPELDRKVAIKVLRPDGRATRNRGELESESTGRIPSQQALRARLLAEGQALARLSSPNVISIYDVGVVDGRVFIAMEFVEGQTLRQWLSEGKKEWKKVLQVFLKAGNGLAAAHAAGLVHRDFKPENVLVGRDERVRVTDFGLARVAPAPERSSPTSEEPKLPAAGTQIGTLLGTPAYMAPEQFLGKMADARSDQFSFCVALFEALHRKRPFAGDSAAQLADSTLKGRVKEATATKVPARLQRALLKGLSVAPENRFASMDALLRELAKQPGARRRWGVVVAAALGAGLVIAGAYRRSWERRQQVCKGAERNLAGVWDDAKRAAVRAAYTSTGVAYGESAFTRKAALLDGYSQKWVASWTEACEATQLSRSQTQAMFEKRQYCLRQRLSELKAITDLLQSVKTIDEVRRLSVSLTPSPLDACSNPQSLQLMPPPPADPAVRAQVEEQGQAAIFSVKALLASKQYPKALDAAEKLAAARPIEYRPLQAEAQLYLGWAHFKMGHYPEAEAAYMKALMLAESSHHDRLAADASLRLTWVTGVLLGKEDISLLWGEHARAAAERIGGWDGLMAGLASARGIVLLQANRFAESVEYLRKDLEIRERATPDQPFIALYNLTGPLLPLGRFDEAEALIRRGLASSEKTLGGRDVFTGLLLTRLTELYWEKRDLARALEAGRRALAINEPGFDGDISSLLISLKFLSLIHGELGEHEKALEYSQRSLNLVRQPPDGVVIAQESPPLLLGEAHVSFGSALAGAGRYSQAIKEHQQAQALYQSTYTPALYMGDVLKGLGRDWLGLGQPKKAADALEQALKTRRNFWEGSLDVAELRFLLAQALWAAQGDVKRAHLLAVAAREAWMKSGEGTSKVAVIDKWLSSHRP